MSDSMQEVERVIPKLAKLFYCRSTGGRKEITGEASCISGASNGEEGEGNGSIV